MFNYNSDEIKQIFELIKIMKFDTFSEIDFKIIFEQYCTTHPTFSHIFSTYRDVLDLWYSLDMIGWIEDFQFKPRMHWHYREVKAIDETYKLPWEQIVRSKDVKFTIHKGT
jgi:hypothetical protein